MSRRHVQHARDEALASARDFLAENIKHGEELDDRRLEVWDEAGVPHFILRFKGAIGVE